MNDKNRMQIIADNITYYRKEKGVTQKELAKAVGVTPSTMTDYMKLRSAPSFGVIQKLADYFEIKKSDIDSTFKDKISPSPTPTPQVLHLDRELKEPQHSAWVNHGENLLKQQDTVENSKNTVDEPHIIYYTYDYYDQPASAGTGQYLNDVQVEQIQLPVDYKADFVVRIAGDSMKPDYHSGDYIFVKLSVDLTDGDIGVFYYEGNAYIKELRINKTGAYLHSLNPDYKDLPITTDTDFRTIGEVIGAYREEG